MDPVIVIIIIPICMIISFLAMTIIYYLKYKRVPPNKAMVIFGRRNPRSKKGYNILTGGGRFIYPIVEEVKYLPLDARNLTFKLSNVKTDPKTENAKIKLEAASIIKIASDQMSLATAAEQLLDKKDDEINKMAYDVIEAHIRAMCKTSKFDDIDVDRDAFASKVGLMAANDLRNIGLEIRSLVIKDVEKIN